MLLTSLATLAGVGILSKAYWNTYRPELKEIEIPIAKKLPADFTILQLTDIHVEKLSVKPEKVKQLVDSKHIDLIALTGDYLDRVKSIDRFLSFLEEVVKIPSRYGVYAVWGNHDWVIKDSLPLLKEKMENLGVTVLENESTTIYFESTPVHIIGIDDHYSGHSDVQAAFENVPDEGVRIILTHDPLVVKMISQPFDYLLCGHFHSGQIYYPIPVHSLKMGLKPFRKYLCGLQHHDRGTYYISGGLGQTGPNLRLGCRPEITVHTLSSIDASQHKKDKQEHEVA